MRGFQLWINLPAAVKMKPAAYRDIPPAQIPVAKLGRRRRGEGDRRPRRGGRPRHRRAHQRHRRRHGPPTPCTWMCIWAPVKPSPIRCRRLPPFAYVYEGVLEVGPAGDAQPLQRQAAGVLSHGERFEARAGGDGARFILLAARPLHEPVVQYGPFVMNTREEIEQALADYRDGRLAA